jgi:alpha-beta hydrolase superfamily lysophospholipase
MNSTNEIFSFKTKDGINLEVGFYPSQIDSVRGIIFFIPCMRGNFRKYRFRYAEIASRGFHLLCLNPRGHGNSEGIFNFNSATEDIFELVTFYRNLFPNLPVIGLGHSGGGSALVRTMHQFQLFTKLYLAAPILDTNESLLWMYKNENISEFISLVGDSKRENGMIAKLLSTNQWLESDYWHNGSWKSLLNEEYKNSPHPQNEIGTFLENLFIPGMQIKNVLANFSNEIQIFLPVEDKWFPIATTLRTAEEFQIPVLEISEAKDHFFRNGWDSIWKYVMNDFRNTI